MEARIQSADPGFPAAGVLAVGFGTTVAMWAIGYFGRIPAVMLPSPLLLLLFLVCLFFGGLVLGRHGKLGFWYGAATGLVSGLLNLLVLGSFLTGDRPNQVVPSALWWVPGSMLLAGLLVGAGAVAGRAWWPDVSPYREWPAAFAWVAIAAALLLLGVGGVVTSAGAGLAVVDWPNSFGYNMFLYPLSRMTGGIYYEHAHRLFGALVGLTTVVLALLLQRRESRAWVRRLAWFAVLLVIVQGVLGGLRVTGHLTLSTDVGGMRPSLTLAMVHGVTGQVFFGLLVALGAFTSGTWRSGEKPLSRAGVGADRLASIVLVVALVGQLVLGAIRRHTSELLLVHIVTGVAVVAPLALYVGVRAWGLNRGRRLLQRLGLALVWAVCLQVLLGAAAWLAIGAEDAGPASTPLELVLTTAHQWFGAVLMALAVSILCWSYRLLEGPLSE